METNHIRLSHTYLPDGYESLQQWIDNFPTSEEKKREVDNWFTRLIYTSKNAFITTRKAYS